MSLRGGTTTVCDDEAICYRGDCFAPQKGARNDRNSMKYYCVYIITNKYHTVLYTGVTGNLTGRIYHHKNKSVSSFSSRYNLNKLVYYEIYEDINEAIKREKQIKGGSRIDKIDLIHKKNPQWRDLYKSLLY